MTAEHAKKQLKQFSSSKDAIFLQKFFKTGKGEYGEGDIFIGVRVPNSRKVAKEFITLPLTEIQQLIHSKIHEERLLGLLILTYQFEKASPKDQKKIYTLYLKHTKHINNWDLVDLSAHKIAGAYLLDKNRSTLYKMARSKLLWNRRIAIVATWTFIRNHELEDTFQLSKILLNDSHDLMHKAVGWMLREAGKKNQNALEQFLKPVYQSMPRTMLRYAIEKFEETKRKKYLKGLI